MVSLLQFKILWNLKPEIFTLFLSYVVAASDLEPINGGNALVKFADDTYLIIPANLSHSTQDEIEHIDRWSAANNLKAKRIQIAWAIVLQTTL